MKAKHLMAEATPKFYGATTIGERGQMVIPAEARKDFNITPASKLLVFGSQGHGGLMIVKAEDVTEFISAATEMLRSFEDVLKKHTGD
jgi:AbrB family looped-hinge helix DNA binding protein